MIIILLRIQILFPLFTKRDLTTLVHSFSVLSLSNQPMKLLPLNFEGTLMIKPEDPENIYTTESESTCSVVRSM